MIEEDSVEHAAEHIAVDRKYPILRVTLDRPEKMNALNREMFEGLMALAVEASTDRRCQAVIFRGSGKAFCAGGDLRGVGSTRSQADPPDPVAGFRKIQEVFDRIEALPMPTIAAINGYALGAGLQLALACDFRIAAAGALLGLPDVKNGIVPGLGATTRLPRLVGLAKAKEMILTGDPISAEEALQIGLVNSVVPSEELEQAVELLCRKLLKRAPLALSAAKHLLNSAAPLEEVASVQIRLMSSADAREGVAAFFEKRDPRFSGK